MSFKDCIKMCKAYKVYCNCCIDFLYLHTFRNCSREKCLLVENIITPQSYCDLCLKNHCKGKPTKCVDKELVLRSDELKSAEQVNHFPGRNIKKR